MPTRDPLRTDTPEPPHPLQPRAGRAAVRSALALAGAVAFLAACSGGGTTGRSSTPGGGGGAAPQGPAPVLVEDRPVAGATAPDVDVRAFAVYDGTADRMLATAAADEPLPVGSLMKLLNARVAYDAGDADREVEVPDGIAGEPGESVIGLVPGQTISRGVLIRAMLKVSANDAARLLAIDIAGSEAEYAALMTDAARDLGLGDTTAMNATGLDAPGQHSTAADLVHLGAALLEEPAFADAVADPDATLNGQSYPNTNDLLVTYAGADGIKTGHTTDAGWCLLASATRDGRQIVAAVLGAPDEAARNDAATRLLDWAFEQT